jgi:hypothetical protein
VKAGLDMLVCFEEVREDFRDLKEKEAVGSQIVTD